MTEEQIKKNLGKGKDLRGKKFERLTPLYPLEKRIKKFIVWHCKCDCGNECNVIGSHLVSGHTRSCGCLQKEQITKLGKSKFIDLSNQKFGKLTVIKKIGTYKSLTTTERDIIYLCKCDCGNEVNVKGNNLRCGHTQSCGCLGSKGEFKISQTLRGNNIKFEQQKTFETCRFPDTNALARFDFYLPEYNILIEFDGEQHFKYEIGLSTWNNKENFEKTQQRDIFKNQWCKNNNISLIRIPYTHYENICIEDLLLNSSFLI